MTVSIPVLTLMAIVVYVLYRHMGLKIWHALACLVVGFLLSSTGAAPQITSVLIALAHEFQALLTNGKG
jgi:hypothetical protein